VANALAMTSACQSFDGILCHSLSHLEHDEANAPEYLTGGAKLLHVDGKNGKIDPDRFLDFLDRGHGYHSVRLRMISITQATEVGTVYSLAELQKLRSIKREMESRLQELYDDKHYQLYLHMDGARLANAVAALKCEPSEIVADVDVLSFGGSKNGAPPTEAIVFFNSALAQHFTWRVKQTGQLVSKMRYLAAPWIGLLQDDVWLANARNANAQTERLGREFQRLGFQPALEIESNMIFVRFNQSEADALQALGWDFYPFQLHDGIAYRFVCNWSTSDQAVDDLLNDVRSIARNG
jgi:threonine aldolase